jgi:hypothetical protein
MSPSAACSSAVSPRSSRCLIPGVISESLAPSEAPTVRSHGRAAQVLAAAMRVAGLGSILRSLHLRRFLGGLPTHLRITTSAMVIPCGTTGGSTLGGPLRDLVAAVLEAGGLNSPARLLSRQLSAGTAASQKSSLRPVEPFTNPRSARRSSSNGSVGVPPWSTRSSNLTWPGFLAIALPFSP